MPNYLDFKVTLAEVKTPPWRRFLLRDTATFQQLHRAIQQACGWMECHLFRFEDLEGLTLANSPHEDPGWSDGPPAPVAAMVKLTRHFHAAGDRCGYNYDFGDDWWHRVELLGFEQREGKALRILLDGKLAFPPEDCGGVGGYLDCIKALKHPAKADKDFLEWLDDWRPDTFDLAKTKAAFDLGKRPRPLRAGFYGL
jgi:hypothetical protein